MFSGTLGRVCLGGVFRGRVFRARVFVFVCSGSEYGYGLTKHVRTLGQVITISGGSGQ